MISLKIQSLERKVKKAKYAYLQLLYNRKVLMMLLNCPWAVVCIMYIYTNFWEKISWCLYHVHVVFQQIQLNILVVEYSKLENLILSKVQTSCLPCCVRRFLRNTVRIINSLLGVQCWVDCTINCCQSSLRSTLTHPYYNTHQVLTLVTCYYSYLVTWLF